MSSFKVARFIHFEKISHSIVMISHAQSSNHPISTISHQCAKELKSVATIFKQIHYEIIIITKAELTTSNEIGC